MNLQRAKEELKKYLDSLSILTLRTLSREVGVYNPTKTAKDELILQTIAVLVGEATPCGRSKRGAPVKEASIDQKYMRELQAICDKYLNEEPFEENIMSVHDSDDISGSLSDYDMPLYTGILELQSNGCGYIREKLCCPASGINIFVPLQFIREHDLREGDYVVCRAFLQKENNNPVINKILSINGRSLPCERRASASFSVLYPQERINFSSAKDSPFLRAVDLFVPIARGQRVLLNAPIGTDATAALRELAFAVKKLSGKKRTVNLHPLVLLLEQRPEECKDFSFLPECDFVYTSFNGTAEEHLRASRVLFNRALRLAEHGEDAVVFLDSLTKLSRISLFRTDESKTSKISFIPDMDMLTLPKQFFLQAGKFNEGGSITVVGVVNTDEESPLDGRIYESFKWIANSRLSLSLRLTRSHFSPAVDLSRSYTEREECLLTAEELNCVCLARENMQGEGKEILELLGQTSDTPSFLRSLKERFSNRIDE